MPRKGWTSVAITDEQYKLIKDLIERRKDLNYDSVASFVADAIRRRIEELKPLR
jgi:hypothetical protein